IQADDLAAMKLSVTLQGQNVNYAKEKRVTVNNVAVVQADMSCGNSIVHGINRVLFPKQEALKTISPMVEEKAIFVADTGASASATELTPDESATCPVDGKDDKFVPGALFRGLKHTSHKIKLFF